MSATVNWLLTKLRCVLVPPGLLNITSSISRESIGFSHLFLSNICAGGGSYSGSNSGSYSGSTSINWPDLSSHHWPAWLHRQYSPSITAVRTRGRRSFISERSDVTPGHTKSHHHHVTLLFVLGLPGLLREPTKVKRNLCMCKGKGGTSQVKRWTFIL